MRRLLCVLPLSLLLAGCGGDGVNCGELLANVEKAKDLLNTSTVQNSPSLLAEAQSVLTQQQNVYDKASC